MGKKFLSGYAVRWGVPSVLIGGKFYEVFQRGAFSESLKNDDIKALWSHKTNTILGRTKNGTLRLFEDHIGLRFEIDLPNTAYGNDIYESVKRGDVDEMSFGFNKLLDSLSKNKSGELTRYVKKARLLEISPVAFPAHKGTSVRAYETDSYRSIRRRELLNELKRDELLRLAQ